MCKAGQVYFFKGNRQPVKTLFTSWQCGGIVTGHKTFVCVHHCCTGYMNHPIKAVSNEIQYVFFLTITTIKWFQQPTNHILVAIWQISILQRHGVSPKTEMLMWNVPNLNLICRIQLVILRPTDTEAHSHSVMTKLSHIFDQKALKSINCLPMCSIGIVLLFICLLF